MTTQQEYIYNQLKEKGQSYFSLDDGYGTISSLTPDEEKRFADPDSDDVFIKMQKYDNEDNLLMTVYCPAGKMNRFRCYHSNGMEIGYSLAPKQTFPIEAPEQEYVNYWINEKDNAVIYYNVGDDKEETKNNFLEASRKQGVASIEAVKTYALIREACDFQREGTIAICRDGHYSQKDFLKIGTGRDPR